jgi:biotin carboxylase
VGDVREAVEVAGQLGHPVVLKPASGSGSVGVRRCDDAAQVETCATELFAARPGEVVLVQHHVLGDEYSVEAFDGRVVGITRKHVTDTGEFVETGHDFPAVLPPDVRSALVTTTERALRALDVAWGATHTELRLGAAGATIIEINPRLAGGMIPRLVHHALGIDLVGGVVERAVGHPVDLVPRRHGGAAIRFLVADRSGALDRITGLEAVAGLPGVVDVGELVAGRRRVDREGSFRDRLAYVVTTAATTTRAAELGDEAVSLLSATWEGIT